MRKKSKLLLSTILSITVLFVGCGGERSPDSNKQKKTIENITGMSAYITKGNFVDVASFAYKKAVNPNFTDYAMNMQLPGSGAGEVVMPLAYEIKVIKVGDSIKKMIVKNYQNSLEIKIVQQNRVNILFKDANFTVDKQMSLDDFLVKVEG